MQDSPWAHKLRRLAKEFSENYEACKFMTESEHECVAAILVAEAVGLEGRTRSLSVEIAGEDGEVIVNGELAAAILATSERIRQVSPNEPQCALLTDHLSALLAVQAHRAGIKKVLAGDASTAESTRRAVSKKSRTS